jgi:glycosyltransferase involved in cell wall biosynthesis
MISRPLNVAVPWSLSHYIPLNGFAPIYRALFDHAPESIALHAWDNVKLHRHFHNDVKIRKEILRKAERLHADRLAVESFAQVYQEFFWPPNRVMTAELVGDIEFHHTVPFPSLTRPFVFHCESVANLLSPFVQDEGIPAKQREEIRAHFGNMLASPLCLGIFSHVPETLESLHKLCSDPTIDRKLFRSRIGLSESAVRDLASQEKVVLSRPRFLFGNSGSQNPADFFRRGGHLVLRFWKEYLASGHTGLLTVTCRKPSDENLSEYGVDVSFVRSQTGRSIFWAHSYLGDCEVNALMAGAHVLLLPSVSLDSVLIMKAMMLGVIPVVTDTVGMSVYVTDNQNGIVLQGVREAIWNKDASTNILVDWYSRRPDLEDSLVSQLTSRVCVLLDRPDICRDMQNHMIAHAREQFSGQAFSDHFWSAVSDLYQESGASSSRHRAASVKARGPFVDCTLRSDEWGRVFDSPVQPTLQIDTGLGVVSEWGGAVIHTFGSPPMDLNDWSVLAEYYRPGAPRMTFANTLEELEGKYLYSAGRYEVVGFTRLTLIGWVAGVLKPFPMLYRVAARILSRLRSVIRPVLEKSKADPDVELVRHGVCGYNIIRRFDRYYAILQNEGAFVSMKAESGGYSSVFSGYSLEEVERAIVGASHSEPELVDSNPLSTDRASRS